GRSSGSGVDWRLQPGRQPVVQTGLHEDPPHLELQVGTVAEFVEQTILAVPDRLAVSPTAAPIVGARGGGLDRSTSPPGMMSGGLSLRGMDGWYVDRQRAPRSARRGRELNDQA